MNVRLTSGFVPMPVQPAAQLPKLRVFVTNLENQTHDAAIEVFRLAGTGKERMVRQELEVPGDERREIELDTAAIQGETVEVVVTVPQAPFPPNTYPVVPGAAVVNLFIGDGTTSLLQWISAGDFVPAEAVLARSGPVEA